MIDQISEIGPGINSNRPGFQKLLEHIENGKVDIIVGLNFARLTRNTEESLKLMHMLIMFDVDIDLVNQPFDLHKEVEFRELMYEAIAKEMEEYYA